MKLEIKNIHKSFGEKNVLKDICFSAESGSTLGLLGRNGAGKTTTIRIIMGVFPADSGEVLLDGAPISKSKVNIGYLPEERGLYPKVKIGEQMIYFAELRGMKRKDAEVSVKKWLDVMQLPEYFDKKLDTLSKGNQQKIQLATALINDPDIIILDEPFSGLDPVNAQLLKDIVRDVAAEGKIVFFSSHQMGQVEQFCDNIALINKGEIVLNGNLKQIKRSYPRENIRIRLREDTFKTINEVLKSESLQNMISDITPHEDECFIKIKDNAAKDLILTELIKNGKSVEEFNVVEPSLEQIFVEKAGEQI